MKLRTFAYCCQSFVKSVARASGVRPLLAPPMTMKKFEPAAGQWLGGKDFIYFKLHGLPNQSFWYGDDWVTALHTSSFREVSLAETVVFVANCYLPESPFLPELLWSHATVIGGSGPNFGGYGRGLLGADLLGYTVRKLLQGGRRASLDDILDLAKRSVQGRTEKMKSRLDRVKLKRKGELAKRIAANEDALAFKIYRHT